MTDTWLDIENADKKTTERLSSLLDERVNNPKHHEMLLSYISEINTGPNSSLLDVGCGNGGVTKLIRDTGKFGNIIGIDPCSKFIDLAIRRSEGIPNLKYKVGRGENIDFIDSSFDVVVLHTVLSHVSNPEKIIFEAKRVLKDGGYLAIFDGDYSTVSFSIHKFDPVQVCINACIEEYIENPWIVPRLEQMAILYGFSVNKIKTFMFHEDANSALMIPWLERGLEKLRNDNVIGHKLSSSFFDEFSRRAKNGSYFGYIGYTSLVLRKV